MRIVIAILFLLTQAEVMAFSPSKLHFCHNKELNVLHAKQKSTTENGNEASIQRRSFVQLLGAGMLILPQCANAASAPKLPVVLSQIKEARAQLDAVPKLIKEEKWDAVRAILITPPLSDCWSKTAKLLTSYAQALGDADGDELAALELKEDALDHLRFLDMAVYNNVFNPIKTEGETGATKELIRSYYEDPVNEYKACVKAFDGLIELGSS